MKPAVAQYVGHTSKYLCLAGLPNGALVGCVTHKTCGSLMSEEEVGRWGAGKVRAWGDVNSPAWHLLMMESKCFWLDGKFWAYYSKVATQKKKKNSSIQKAYKTQINWMMLDEAVVLLSIRALLHQPLPHLPSLLLSFLPLFCTCMWPRIYLGLLRCTDNLSVATSLKRKYLLLPQKPITDYRSSGWDSC